MNKQQSCLFLLGGHDLEMAEIRNILEELGIPYHDRGLKWGALLSDYSDILSSDAEHFSSVYGIELIEDVSPPAQYRAIDHHNERSDMPSSVEQVCEILGYPMSRYLRLVSANDTGYIPAMVRLGASETEVSEIRKRDRREQGVTEEEEKKALEELKNVENLNGTFVIKTSLDNFSPLADGIYPANSILIYNDCKFTLYGKRVPVFRKIIKSRDHPHRYYYGGGECGFAGGELSEELLQLLTEIILQ